MKIYFVRHGQSESNKKGRLTGNLHSPLTGQGIRQAKKISLKASLDFSKIYSSDSIRCRQTADIINKKLSVSIIYDPRLRQRDFGSLGGKTWKEIGEDLKEIDKNQQN